jgi:hypothetical protein
MGEKKAPSANKSTQKGFLSLFDNEITNAFTILAAVGAIISLLPAFSTFLVGSDWIPALLSNETGFLTIILLIAASYLGLIFMIILIIALLQSAYSKIFNIANQSSHQEKVAAFILILVGASAIFFSALFLFFVWIAKTDFAINYTILMFIIICEFLFILFLAYVILSILVAVKILKSNSKWDVFVKPVAIIIYIVITVVIFYLAYPATVDYVNNITHYYDTGKSIPVEIKIDSIYQNNKTPVSIHLNKTTDAYFGKNLSIFDLPYAQCHWWTNYGYFLTITSNNSVIQKQSQDVIIPGCGNFEDKTYWTYEVSDFGKNKPQIIIGLTVEDRNKKVNNMLGNARIIFNWSGTDSININNSKINLDQNF